MKLGTKLTILILSTIITIMTVHAVIDVRDEQRNVSQLMQSKVEHVAKTLRSTAALFLKEGRLDKLQQIVEEVGSLDEILSVSIIDSDWKVVTDTNRAEIGRPSELKTLLQLKGKEGTTFYRYYDNYGGGRAYNYIYPVEGADGALIGAVKVAMSMEKADAIVTKVRNRVILAIVTITLLLFFSIFYFTRTSIIRPITELMLGAKRIGRGDLDWRIAVKKGDEVGQLASEFNKMAENLSRTRDEVIAKAQERLELESKFQRSEKLAALGTLASSFVHEIATPLNIIGGRAERALKKIACDEDARKHLNIIASQVDRLAKIVHQFLGFASKKPPIFKPIDVNETVKSALDFIRYKLKSSGVECRLELDPSLPKVKADADQLQQVLLNLLMNSLQAMPEGGMVRIGSSLGRVGGVERVAISIQDTGCGISPEYLKKIFDPFFTTKGFGTGLGLSVSRGIIEDHGGTIEVQSEPGRGSVFTVTVPVIGGQ